ncbi:MAG: hypothetical protein IJH25_09700 [Clostridia bacterium]|nr:hypothetical protein [Clostridia bacterium]MBQ9038651.1 hypothetical protein [Clostridia bacterium]
MKKTVRKVAVLVFVMALIVSICMPAFAAKPSVKLVSRPTTAYRGYYMYHKYFLNSGSYYRTGAYGYRANYDGFIYRRATGKLYAKWDFNFTGRIYHTLKTAVYYSWPRGAYRTYVRTYYRPYASYNRWTFVRSFNWYFNVR